MSYDTSIIPPPGLEVKPASCWQRSLSTLSDAIGNLVADCFLICFGCCNGSEDLPEKDRKRANRLGHRLLFLVGSVLLAGLTVGSVLTIIEYANGKSDNSIGLVFSSICWLVVLLLLAAYAVWMWRAHHFCSCFYASRRRSSSHLNSTSYGSLEQPTYSSDSEDLEDDDDDENNPL
jgi:hypothetical protein